METDRKEWFEILVASIFVLVVLSLGRWKTEAQTYTYCASNGSACVWTNSNTFNGPTTVGQTGNVALKPGASNAIQYVSPNGSSRNDGLSWGTSVWGSDAGAALNTAYAHLPPTGGIIYIASLGGCGSTSSEFSTPVSFATNDKVVTVIGAGPNATCLHYTPSTGTAMTFATGGGSEYSNDGIENVQIESTAPGSRAVGLALGDSSNNEGRPLIVNTWVNGFQYDIDDYSYGAQFVNSGAMYCSYTSNSIAFRTGAAGNSNADDTHIDGGELQGCTTLLSIANGNPVWALNLIMAGFTTGIPNTATWVSVGTGVLYATNCHWYEGGMTAATWFTNSGGGVMIMNAQFEDADPSGSSTSYATQSGGWTNIYSATLYSAGHSVSEFINWSGGTVVADSIRNDSAARIPYIYNGNSSDAFALPVVSQGSPFSLRAGEAVVATGSNQQMYLKGAGEPPMLKGGPSAFSSAPPCSSSAEGEAWAITDSTTNSWGAAVAGGGSDHVLAYCDGSSWKVAAR